MCAMTTDGRCAHIVPRDIYGYRLTKLRISAARPWKQHTHWLVSVGCEFEELLGIAHPQQYVSNPLPVAEIVRKSIQVAGRGRVSDYYDKTGQYEVFIWNSLV